MKIQRVLIVIQSLIFILFFLSSCTSTRYITHTKRSGVEQLLVTKAIDRAVAKIDNLHISGSRIFFEIASLAPEEEAYLKKALTHWFLENGAIMVDDRNEADLIASVLVKCVSTDRFEAGFGIPSIPIPLAGVVTPKIDIFGIKRQKGYSEMEIAIYSSGTGKFKQKTDSLIGKARFDTYTILLIPVPSNNIY
ncbi:MAG: hypothetical protein AMJ45_06095 [Syntrophobacter sp. DG_60]|nr:MAG: hypothetical protein AMJ45_06095 [Syntrophobacter sp. DG_60]